MILRERTEDDYDTVTHPGYVNWLRYELFMPGDGLFMRAMISLAKGSDLVAVAILLSKESSYNMQVVNI